MTKKQMVCARRLRVRVMSGKMKQMKVRTTTASGKMRKMLTAVVERRHTASFSMTVPW